MIKNKMANGLLAAGVIGGGLLGGAISMAGVGAESASVQAVTASAQQDETGNADAAREHHAERVGEALAPLVEDGTITQAQADAVAAQLAEAAPIHRGDGHRGDGAMRDAITETLGLEADALGELLRDGSTLADVAEEQGVSVDDLSAAMKAALTESVNEKVADGSITQERADEILADADERITDRINGEGPKGHGRRGPGGPGAGEEGVN